MIFDGLGPRTLNYGLPGNVGHPGYVPVMTLEEARSHIGHSVLYSAAGAEAEDAVIANVTGLRIRALPRRSLHVGRPEDLTAAKPAGQSEARAAMPDTAIWRASQAGLTRSSQDRHWSPWTRI